MKLGERVACVETEIKSMKKLIWFLIISVAGSAGLDYLPLL